MLFVYTHCNVTVKHNMYTLYVYTLCLHTMYTLDISVEIHERVERI